LQISDTCIASLHRVDTVEACQYPQIIHRSATRLHFPFWNWRISNREVQPASTRQLNYRLLNKVVVILKLSKINVLAS